MFTVHLPKQKLDWFCSSPNCLVTLLVLRKSIQSHWRSLWAMVTCLYQRLPSGRVLIFRFVQDSLHLAYPLHPQVWQAWVPRDVNDYRVASLDVCYTSWSNLVATPNWIVARKKIEIRQSCETLLDTVETFEWIVTYGISVSFRIGHFTRTRANHHEINVFVEGALSSHPKKSHGTGCSARKSVNLLLNGHSTKTTNNLLSGQSSFFGAKFQIVWNWDAKCKIHWY